MTAGAILVPIAVASLREVRCKRELPFAALPALFALHQFTEAFVWLGVDGHVSHRVESDTAVLYLIFALVVLPTLLPLSVWLLEPRGARQRVSPFLALGLVVSAYLAYVLAASPIRVVQHPHALQYLTGVQHGAVWAVVYVVAVIGPALMSGYQSIVAFGVLNLIGLVCVAVLLFDEFDSIWCVYAGLVSGLVLLHMWRRRHLPDPHRLHGQRPATV